MATPANGLDTEASNASGNEPSHKGRRRHRRRRTRSADQNRAIAESLGNRISTRDAR